MKDESVRDGSGSSAARWSEQPDPKGHAQRLPPSQKEEWRGYVVFVNGVGYVGGDCLEEADVYSDYREAAHDASIYGGVVWSYSRARLGGFGTSDTGVPATPSGRSLRSQATYSRP